VSIVLDAERVLAAGGPELAEAAKVISLAPLDLALYGGEDYALLMTFAPGDVPPPFVEIGLCQTGAGIFLQATDGTQRPIDPRGFDHFPASS
jgi:thiamine-monophosphate kinase